MPDFSKTQQPVSKVYKGCAICVDVCGWWHAVRHMHTYIYVCEVYIAFFLLCILLCIVTV